MPQSLSIAAQAIGKDAWVSRPYTRHLPRVWPEGYREAVYTLDLTTGGDPASYCEETAAYDPVQDGIPCEGGKCRKLPARVVQLEDRWVTFDGIHFGGLRWKKGDGLQASVTCDWSVN